MLILSVNVEDKTYKFRIDYNIFIKRGSHKIKGFPTIFNSTWLLQYLHGSWPFMIVFQCLVLKLSYLIPIFFRFFRLGGGAVVSIWMKRFSPWQKNPLMVSISSPDLSILQNQHKSTVWLILNMLQSLP